MTCWVGWDSVSGVDVIKLFGRKSRFPRNQEIEKKFVTMSEPAQKCENNTILCKTILKNCLFLLIYPILAVLALGEI